MRMIGLGGAAAVLLSVSSYVLMMAVIAAVYISRWFLFKKMRMPGWKGIIPFYSEYLLFRILWKPKMFWVYIISAGVYTFVAVICCVVTMVCGLIAAGGADYERTFLPLMFISLAVYGILTLGYLVFALILTFKLYHRLAKAFGKSTGFAVGLTFLNPIFQMILAFDKSVFLL